MVQAALTLHHNHHLYDTNSGKEISFGVVRFANIDPCVAFAKYICKCTLPENTEVKVMVYHSRQTLLLRHEQELYLDSILKRHGEDPNAPTILSEPLIRRHINNSHAKTLIFAVVCTPAEEVGRDHDYDWAVIEPSSWRSIIQMAGRVNRHRQSESSAPNIAIIQYNFRCFKAEDKKYQHNGNLYLYYTKPGYEAAQPSMPSHDLDKLLPSGWNGIITAADRLEMVTELKIPPQNGNIIAWYEHKVINKLLLNKNEPDSMNNYPKNYWDLSAIPQQLSRFRDGNPTITLTFKKCDPDKNYYSFYISDKLNNLTEAKYIYNINNTSLQDLNLYNDRLWLIRNYHTSVEKYAELHGLQESDIMNRFGTIEVPDYGNDIVSWNYSDTFGMYKSGIEELNKDDR